MASASTIRLTRRRTSASEEEIIARDARGYGIGRLEIRWGMKWVQVRYIQVGAQHRRKGIATMLYAEAARIACDELALPLVSDYDLSDEARAFWQKQVGLGRAKWNAESEVFVLDCNARSEGLGAAPRGGGTGLSSAPGDTDALGQELTETTVVELKRLFERADIVLEDQPRQLTAEVSGRDKGRHKRGWAVGVRHELRAVDVVVETPITKGRAVTPAQPTDIAYAWYMEQFRGGATLKPLMTGDGGLIDWNDVGFWRRSSNLAQESREAHLGLAVYTAGRKLAGEIERVWLRDHPGLKARLPEYWMTGELQQHEQRPGENILLASYFNRLGLQSAPPVWNPHEVLWLTLVTIDAVLNWPTVRHSMPYTTQLWRVPGPSEEYVTGELTGQARHERVTWGGGR